MLDYPAATHDARARRITTPAVTSSQTLTAVGAGGRARSFDGARAASSVTVRNATLLEAWTRWKLMMEGRRPRPQKPECGKTAPSWATGLGILTNWNGPHNPSWRVKRPGPRSCWCGERAGRLSTDNAVPTLSPSCSSCLLDFNQPVVHFKVYCYYSTSLGRCTQIHSCPCLYLFPSVPVESYKFHKLCYSIVFSTEALMLCMLFPLKPWNQ